MLSAGEAKGPWCGCGGEAARERGQGVPQAACATPHTFLTVMLLLLLPPPEVSVATAVVVIEHVKSLPMVLGASQSSSTPCALLLHFASVQMSFAVCVEFAWMFLPLAGLLA